MNLKYYDTSSKLNIQTIEKDFSKISCVEIQIKPLFIYINGGVHYKYDPEETITKVFIPILDWLHTKYKNCTTQLHVIMSGVPYITNIDIKHLQEQ